MRFRKEKPIPHEHDWVFVGADNHMVYLHGARPDEGDLPYKYFTHINFACKTCTEVMQRTVDGNVAKQYHDYYANNQLEKSLEEINGI